MKGKGRNRKAEEFQSMNGELGTKDLHRYWKTISQISQVKPKSMARTQNSPWKKKWDDRKRSPKKRSKNESQGTKTMAQGHHPHDKKKTV